MVAGLDRQLRDAKRLKEEDIGRVFPSLESVVSSPVGYGPAAEPQLQTILGRLLCGFTQLY